MPRNASPIFEEENYSEQLSTIKEVDSSKPIVTEKPKVENTKTKNIQSKTNTQTKKTYTQNKKEAINQYRKDKHLTVPLTPAFMKKKY